MTLGATKLEGEATRAGGRGLTWAGRIGIGLGVLGIGLSGLTGLLMLGAALLGPAKERAIGLTATVVFGGGGFAMSLLPLGLGVLLWWLGRRKPSTQQRVEVCEDGVRIDDNGKVHEWAWGAITGFRRSPGSGRLGMVKVSVPYTFFAVAVGDTEVRIEGVPNLQSMGEAIEDATFPLLLERAKATLAEGGSVDFGDIRATPAGVQGFGLLGGTVAWDDVQGFGLGKHNRVALREKGVPVAQNGPFAFEVPNLAVLFALA